MTSCYVTSRNETLHFGELISQHIRSPKNGFFQYFTKGTACLQNLSYKMIFARFTRPIRVVRESSPFKEMQRYFSKA